MRYTKTYNSWKGMKARCDNSNRVNYEYYGSSGVTYPRSWKFYDNFLLDMGERPEGTTLDRIDNTKGYSKENCRWATPSQQTRNSSHTSLNPIIVKYFRKVRARSSLGNYQLAKELEATFQIPASTIGKLFSGTTWNGV